MARRRVETGDRPGESKRTLGPLKHLLPYLARQKTRIAGALVCLTLAALTTLSLPIAVRRVVDRGFFGGDIHLIDAYFGMLMVLAAVLAVASAGRYYFVITLGERIVADLRRDVFAHVIRLPPAFYDRTLSGEIVSRLTADTTLIKSVVGATASVALRNLILCFGALGMMVWTSPRLSALAVAAIPLIVLPLMAFGRSVRRKSRLAQDTLAGAGAYAGEAIGAVRTVQAFTNEDAATDRYAAAVDEAFAAARSSVTSRAFLTAIAILLVFASVVAVLWIGTHRVANGTMSAGTLGQFLLYAVFAAGSLGALSEVWGEVTQAAGATERLVELLAERPAIVAPPVPAALPRPANGAVDIEDVSFAYADAPDRAILRGVSLHVRPGETVAIVGPSGSGKSTLFSLIERFYDPTAGRISIDGVDIRTADPQDVRRRIAFVPQDIAVFAASIADNIAFGSPGASTAAIEKAAKAALADAFIRQLPNGYETQIGERGVLLSGGQRQRIAIARAVLRDAPILLLDEATSALDAESELLVQRALDHLMKDRTTIVIAHRLATVLKADRILVMDNGRIVEQGTHAELMAGGALYARLARLQFDLAGAATAAE